MPELISNLIRIQLAILDGWISVMSMLWDCCGVLTGENRSLLRNHYSVMR